MHKLQKLADDLALALCSLDLLSRDDLESRIGREKIDYLNGLLLLLNQHAGALESKTQVRGKPTDHAAEDGLLSWLISTKTRFQGRPMFREKEYPAKIPLT